MVRRREEVLLLGTFVAKTDANAFVKTLVEIWKYTSMYVCCGAGVCWVSSQGSVLLFCVVCCVVFFFCVCVLLCRVFFFLRPGQRVLFCAEECVVWRVSSKEERWM